MIRRFSPIVTSIPAFIESEGGIAYLKYVRVDGEYRFGNATSWGMDHRSLANEEPVESASFLFINPDGLYVEGSSQTLNIILTSKLQKCHSIQDVQWQKM